MALGRLANYSDDLAETLVQNEVLPQLVYSLSEQNRFYKKAAAFCLRAVAKHSPPLAQASPASQSLPCYPVAYLGLTAPNNQELAIVSLVLFC